MKRHEQENQGRRAQDPYYEDLRRREQSHRSERQQGSQPSPYMEGSERGEYGERDYPRELQREYPGERSWGRQQSGMSSGMGTGMEGYEQSRGRGQGYFDRDYTGVNWDPNRQQGQGQPNEGYRQDFRGETQDWRGPGYGGGQQLYQGGLAQGNYGQGGFGQGGAQGSWLQPSPYPLMGEWGNRFRQTGGSMERGPHSGRGPKNYKRSDQRIEEEINDMLTQHGDIDASEIEVKVSNGDVTLSGSVDERQAKHMAEDIAGSVMGVKDVNNQIRIKHTAGTEQYPTRETASSTSTSGSRKNETQEEHAHVGRR
jgi:hypothetical protein